MGLLLWMMACGSDSENCGGGGRDVATCRYNSPPNVVILSPADGAQTPPALTAVAMVADDQSELLELVIRWIAGAEEVLTEADADGQVSTELLLSPGLQLLRVEVIDPEAEMGSDEIQIEVLAP
jgi:hypothetical protein